ncbi:MAG: hypothetical protein ACR2QZ_00765 [Woeseiaceae bacterium]
MQSTKTFDARPLIFVACALLAACASRPELEPKARVVPAGIDLSGKWTLRDEPGSRERRSSGQESRIRVPRQTSSRNQGRQPKRRSRKTEGTAVIVFLESGESLKITQTSTSLFISFDRAIVEEFHFGENRLVSVGPIEAQRVSGWQDQRFVTETLDESGAILREFWELSSDGDVLVRNISVTDGEKEQFSSEQRFDRL